MNIRRCRTAIGPTRGSRPSCGPIADRMIGVRDIDPYCLHAQLVRDALYFFKPGSVAACIQDTRSTHVIQIEQLTERHALFEHALSQTRPAYEDTRYTITRESR